MIFCFTGIGNSLYTAKQLLDPELISIPQAIHNDRLTFEADSIGIVCPVYGHEMPAMVKEFLRKADIFFGGLDRSQGEGKIASVPYPVRIL